MDQQEFVNRATALMAEHECTPNLKTVEKRRNGFMVFSNELFYDGPSQVVVTLRNATIYTSWLERDGYNNVQHTKEVTA